MMNFANKEYFESVSSVFKNTDNNNDRVLNSLQLIC